MAKNNNNKTTVKIFTFKELDTSIIEINISIVPGTPSINIIESTIRNIMAHLGVGLPPSQIRISIPPKYVYESHYTLGIICGLLIHMNLLHLKDLSSYVFFGEVNLNGHMPYTPGSLPAALHTIKNNFKLIGSGGSSQELSCLHKYKSSLLLFNNLLQLLLFFNIRDESQVVSLSSPSLEQNRTNNMCFDISSLTKRLLEIALIGHHNLLLVGALKDCNNLVRCMSYLSPNLTFQESLEVSSIYSMIGSLNHQFITRPPLQLFNASQTLKELYLSHGGILFMSELKLLHASTLYGIKDYLQENTRVPIQLVIGTEDKHESSSPFLNLASIKYTIKSNKKIIEYKENWMEATRQKITQIRDNIRHIYHKVSPAQNMSNIPFYILKQYLILTDEAKSFMSTYRKHQQISRRRYENIIRISYSISLWHGENTISKLHIKEAIFLHNS